MDNAAYASLTRQTGLRREMQVVANNIANASTDGFRREGIVFSEFVKRQENGDTSLSMAAAHGRTIDTTPGQLVETGAVFDFAIEGDGYFLLQTPDGDRLTRAGSFRTDAEGAIVAADGSPLLDAGGAPVFVPADARSVALSADGTLSADGRPLAQIGVFAPLDPLTMRRESGVRFAAEDGLVPVEDVRLSQGFLEASNVDPILEVSRMIEVQRAYERGRALLDGEHERIRGVIQTLGR